MNNNPNPNLPEQGTVMVSGVVVYNRIHELVTSEEDIKKFNENRAFPITEPFTTITISDPEIVPKEPGRLNELEQFVQTKFYKSNTTGKIQLQLINRKHIPNVSQVDLNNPNHIFGIKIKNNLAVGLHVRILIRVFTPKFNPGKRSLGLSHVIIMEPVRYFESGIGKELESYGMVYTPMPDEIYQDIMEKNNSNMEDANKNHENNHIPSSVSSASSNQADPYITTAANNMPPVNPNPVQAAMNPPTQPKPKSPWKCTNCGNTNPANTDFCGTCGTKRPNEHTVENPYVNKNGVVNTGLTYDPNDSNRAY